MSKRTSPQGKVYEISGKPIQTYLYDFDIDGHTLKSAHIEWLDRKIVQPIRLFGSGVLGSRWFVWIFGNASRTGDDAHNLFLSQRRAQAVEKYLAERLVGKPHHLMAIPLSESKAAQDGWSDDVELEFYRSVTIVMDLYVTPPMPPPPKPKPPPRQKNKPFQLCLLDAKVSRSILGVGLNFVGTVLIADLSTRNEAKYTVETLVDTPSLLPDTPWTPPEMAMLLGFKIRVPGIPSYFPAAASQTERSFEGYAKIEHARLPRNQLPGTMDFRFNPDKSDTFVRRGFRIHRLLTGPIMDVDGPWPKARVVELEPSPKTLFAGFMKLQQ
jgi:hypothetical protein